MEEQKENNNIDNNKSNIFPIRSFQKKKRKSVQLGLDHLNQIVENYSLQMKNVEGNKFKNIPKNKKLTNLSLVLINNEIQNPSNKDKNYYLNLLKNTDQSIEKEEEENAFIKKKLKEMNERVAILQTGRKRGKRKGKTIKERSNFINALNKHAKLKKRRKGSFNADDKISKNSGSKKRRKKKFNSSKSIVNLKDKQAKEIDNIRHIINGEEKIKKLYLISEKKESEDKKESEGQKDSSAKMSNSVTDNDYKIYIHKAGDNTNKNSNTNKNNNKNNEDNKNKNINENDKNTNKNEIKIKKVNNNNNNKKEKKKEVTNINNNININYIETKNNYEVKKEEKKENKKNKKRKFFCFCCLTKEDNSSDFD